MIDRGLQSTRVMKDFDEKSVKFIIRSKMENRKFEEIESFLDGKKISKWDDWAMKDSKVKLLHWKPVLNKRGNIHHSKKSRNFFT